VFTRRLIEALELHGDKTTVAEAYKKLHDSVEQEVQFDRVSQQTPMLLSRWNGQDLELSAVPAEPREVLPEIQAEEMIYSTPSATAGMNRAVPAIPAPKVVANLKPPKIAAAVAPPASNSIVPTVQANSLTSDANPVLIPMMWTSWSNNGGDVTLELGTRRVIASELRQLSKRRLLMLYNEAYARHGRGFVSKEIQRYFDSQPWYRMDPDYHWRPDDPRVVARKSTDDNLVVNEKRTPKQWLNMQVIKQAMEQK